MRDHPMLIAERPSHVNLKNLVIDGIARLEGQAGTRAQVVQKCMESQYVTTRARSEQYSSWVGGALDRMNAEKWDPALTYDQDRKLWIYLHGDRTTVNWKQKSRELQAVKKQTGDKPVIDDASNQNQSTSGANDLPQVKVEPQRPAAPSFVPGPSLS